MIRKLTAATLGLMVGMVLLASPAQAQSINKAQVGEQWDSKTCVKGSDNDGTCWLTYPGGESTGSVRIWANDATHEVRWHFNTPAGCNPSGGCSVTFDVANEGYPCGVGGADSSITTFNGTTTKVQSRVNTNKDTQDRQCTIAIVNVWWEW